MMVLISAAVQAADMFTAPVEKFIMAGDATMGEQAEDGHEAAGGIGQENADELAFTMRELGQLAAQHEAAGDRAWSNSTAHG